MKLKKTITKDKMFIFFETNSPFPGESLESQAFSLGVQVFCFA